jgi:N-acetyl-anhydromuramyl-L-alanine amidase AmpD
MKIQNHLIRTNYDKGRGVNKPEAIVIHIAQGSLNGADAWFNNPQAQASAHYMVGRQAQIWRFVKDGDTAWHAGAINRPSWKRLKRGVNPNLYTIGIEIEGFYTKKFTKKTYEALGWLICRLCKKHSIPIRRSHIIGHYQIDGVNRANDPGPNFDFDKVILIARKYMQKDIDRLDIQLQRLQNDLKDAKLALRTTKGVNEQLEQDKLDLETQVDELEYELKQMKDAVAEFNFLRKLYEVFKSLLGV